MRIDHTRPMCPVAQTKSLVLSTIGVDKFTSHFCRVRMITCATRQSDRVARHAPRLRRVCSECLATMSSWCRWWAQGTCPRCHTSRLPASMGSTRTSCYLRLVIRHTSHVDWPSSPFLRILSLLRKSRKRLEAMANEQQMVSTLPCRLTQSRALRSRKSSDGTLMSSKRCLLWIMTHRETSFNTCSIHTKAWSLTMKECSIHLILKRHQKHLTVARRVKWSMTRIRSTLRTCYKLKSTQSTSEVKSKLKEGA